MKIENIEVFPNAIRAGITLRNLDEFPPIGFSISRSEFISQNIVLQKRKILANQLKISVDKMKFQKQIHSDIIRYIDEKSTLQESDAMFTDKKGIVLNISIADCCAVLIYDKKKQIIAGIHSGWRGTAKNITNKTVSRLIDKFNSKTEDMICYISACASGKNYEVGEDVAKYFPKSIESKQNGKFLFDNKNEIKLQLLDAGLRMSNIFISDICTIENQDYHSYRRDKEKSGRMSAFISMID